MKDLYYAEAALMIGQGITSYNEVLNEVLNITDVDELHRIAEEEGCFAEYARRIYLSIPEVLKRMED